MGAPTSLSNSGNTALICIRCILDSGQRLRIGGGPSAAFPGYEACSLRQVYGSGTGRAAGSGDGTHVGCVLAPDFVVTRVDDVDATAFGAYGGLIANRRLLVGASVYATTDQ